jgi:hypothetical protein
MREEEPHGETTITFLSDDLDGTPELALRGFDALISLSVVVVHRSIGTAPQFDAASSMSAGSGGVVQTS